MPRAAICPDNASILVAGESDVALEVTRLLRDQGAWVWHLQQAEDNRCACTRQGWEHGSKSYSSRSLIVSASCFPSNV